MSNLEKHSFNVVKTIEELRKARKQLPLPMGLVPTMGYLHEGHLSLVRRARSECASVVVSIFVNPTQFGPQEDLQTYPRDIPRDLQLLEPEGIDLLWLPDNQIMYPEEFQTWVTVEKVAQGLEGAKRPGHFRGVATVVAKLFNCVQPDKAYFGQKDAQQAVVVQRMVSDLNFPIKIVVCPIVREVDGLAMSSRNRYLTAAERQSAAVLYRSLMAGYQAFVEGERQAERLRKIITEIIQLEPRAQLEYVSCADPINLEEMRGPVN
ncbi:MAG: pantoate--beta-alanine ligase, partial [Anaerolineales bacterium]|nr:pantoate--beta-alanine ligase [Anaerolineales bacterium]